MTFMSQCRRLLLLAAGLSMTACGFAGLSGSPGFGATQGGVQDMGLARELIDAGNVPPPEAFVVEGMFSEHELGLSGPACRTVLCLRQGLGLAPTLDGEAAAWLQIGMSSTIDPSTFVRPSLTLVAAVDISGSMGAGAGDEGDTLLDLAKDLVGRMSAQLGAEDRFALVSYGSWAETRLDLTRGDDRSRIEGAIGGLRTGGSTAMEDGMMRAYELARRAVGSTEQVRVIVFSDAQPNVGGTGPESFAALAAAGADAGVGLTVLGLGTGLGQDLMNHMVTLKGGNAFTVFEREHLDLLMEEHWPWMVSPIAYDLSVSLTHSEGHAVRGTYGFPGEAAAFEVATVFLSRRKGALLVQLGLDGAEGFGGLSTEARLTYQTPAGMGHTVVLEGALEGAETLDAGGRWFAQPGVGRTVALAILVSGMRTAAERYGDEPEAAVAHLEAALARFTSDVEALEAEDLAPEIALTEALLGLMREGAPQGDLYGEGW